MPMNNGNMPNTDGRENAARRTERPDGAARGNGEYQSGGMRKGIPLIRRQMRACVKTPRAGIRETLSAQAPHDRVRGTMPCKAERGGDLKMPVQAVRIAGRIMPPRRSITAAVHISERARPRVRRHSVPRAGEKRFRRKSARSSAKEG